MRNTPTKVLMNSEIGNTRITEFLPSKYIKGRIMDSKAYFEKVMQDFNQFREGRSLRKYCSDEGIDYNWVIKYKKEYPGKRNEEENPVAPLAFIPVSVKEEPQQKEWQVEQLVLQSPTGETVEIKSTSLSVVAMLLEKMS